MLNDLLVNVIYLIIVVVFGSIAWKMIPSDIKDFIKRLVKRFILPEKKIKEEDKK